MDFHLLGREDTHYEANGRACDSPNCGLSAVFRFCDGRDGYVYGCDDHFEWAQIKARSCNCDDCGHKTNRPKIWRDTDDGMSGRELALCPECWADRHQQYIDENPSEFDDPVIEEDPYAMAEGDDEDVTY